MPSPAMLWIDGLLEGGKDERAEIRISIEGDRQQ